MNYLSNAFSVLNLDAEDDKDQTIASAATSNGVADVASTSKSGKGQKKDKGSMTIIPPKNDIGKNESLSISSEEYRLPLVWIDLEMTGLDIEVDLILEIACIITDGNLKKMVEGPDLVIHQTKECLDNMGEWCQNHHAASGLTERVLQSTITERDAEKQVIEFVKRHVGTYTPLLAGNSVYVDFSFLKKYMPDLAALFSHVLVDVSSVKALCIRWYPKERKKAPSKVNRHRAMDDIKESINELRYFREHIFKGPKSRQ